MVYLIVYDKLHKFSIEDGILAVGLALITVGIGYNLKSKLAGQKVELIKAAPTSVVIVVDKKITFDISGQVQKPGVYVLPKGSRVNEALATAGGLAANADREWVEKNINKARSLIDGEKIYIPKKSENYKVESAVVLGATVSKIININSAVIEELDKLDGVGPAIAQRIIDYRQKNGEFKDINEIKMVSGIGDKMFEKIKEQIGI